MNRNLFNEGSTWGGIGAIVTGLGAIFVSKDYATGVGAILAGVMAILKK